MMSNRGYDVPRMVDGRGGEGSGGEAGSMEDDRRHERERERAREREREREREEQPPIGLRHLYGQKKTAARRAVNRARRGMEKELYRKLDE